MKFTNKQKAFLEFIPVSEVRKKMVQMYAITLFLVPFMISYYFNIIDASYQVWKFIVILIDIVLIILSIPVIIKPQKYFGGFHLLLGFTSIYVSMLFYISFLIEISSVRSLTTLNLLFSLIIYLLAIFIENYLIINTNFLKYPKSISKKVSTFIVFPVMGMLVYSLISKTFIISVTAIAAFLLAIALGIPIHSLYRGFIIIKNKYEPSDTL